EIPPWEILNGRRNERPRWRHLGSTGPGAQLPCSSGSVRLSPSSVFVRVRLALDQLHGEGGPLVGQRIMADDESSLVREAGGGSGRPGRRRDAGPGTRPGRGPHRRRRLRRQPGRPEEAAGRLRLRDALPPASSPTATGPGSSTGEGRRARGAG